MVVALGAFGVAIIGTGIVRRYSIRRRLLDLPNARSSHVGATPRGGGMAIVVAFLFGILGLLLSDSIHGPLFWALLVGGVAVAAIGFIDDHRPVSPKARILVHLGAAGWAIYCIGGGPSLDFGFIRLELGIWGYPLGTLAIAWLLNLYNFMDGIDGLAASQAVFTAGLGTVFLLVAGGAWMPSLLIAAAAGGFLLWNWPPAKIFMGDAGSGFLGYTLGVIAFYSAVEGFVPIWSWVILLGVFVADATVTLVRRLLRGEHWWEAHRLHAYQQVTQRIGEHKPVTLGILAINLCVLGPAAWLAFRWPEWGFAIATACMAALVYVAVALGAGRPQRPVSADV